MRRSRHREQSMPVVWQPEASIEAIRIGALRGVVMAANVVRNEVLRRIMQDAKTGRIYRRRGVEHQASAPGQAPASDQGTLVRNITVEVDDAALTARVNSAAKHAVALEFGTDKMEPRPYMRVSLDAKIDEITAIVAQEIERELAR
jgi:HK97 gp10 family phage protein